MKKYNELFNVKPSKSHKIINNTLLQNTQATQESKSAQVVKEQSSNEVMIEENAMDVPKLQTKINQDQNLETKLDWRMKKEKELFHTWTGRKQKFYISEISHCTYTTKKIKKKSEFIKCRFCKKENQRDTYDHWKNSCQNKQVRKIFDQENTSINTFVKDFKNLLTEEKEFIWTMKYQSYVQIHKIKLCSKLHK
jgi:hypothetical protein